jgi:SagB-type dehydrogenase family enzyme
LRISDQRQEFRVRAPSSVLATVLARLADQGGATKDELCDQALQSGESSGLFSLLGVLRALDARGMLQRGVMADGRPFATLTPSARGFQFDEGPFPDGKRQLSRFTYLHKVGCSIRVESALGCARIELHDERAAAVTVALARARSGLELECLFPELTGDSVQGLLILLNNAAALVDSDNTEQPGVSCGMMNSGNWWEFHDLLFHMRSRRGRHDSPYGGTYRANDVSPPPLIKPPFAARVQVPLYRPDLDRLRETDPPFTDIVERRRSIRTYGPDPLTAEQLGEFLYRSARYQSVLQGENTDYALRPAPAGGGLHELEVYPVVARCRGIEPGVYHYRPAEHVLTPVASPSPLFDRLLDDAWKTGNRESPLNVYFQITARCQRVFWKYESMAYALVLKNLGALYGTMYLVATAMDLAPCALGGGDSELFSSVSGIDPCEEPAVGEFLLGTRARDLT